MEVRQYQVVIVNLDPTIGSEIQKTRPCLVISPNEMNRNLRTVVIAPITSIKKFYPTRVRVVVEKKVSRVALDQIRTIDRQRITRTGNQLGLKEIVEVKTILKRTYVD